MENENSKNHKYCSSKFEYIKGDDKNKKGAVFQSVLDEENDFLKERRDNVTKKDKKKYQFNSNTYSGLALSGGGIRSASFSLGVLQYLARNDHLKKFDYLSTVSGGGYIGTSLSWLLHQPTPKKPNKANEPNEPKNIYNTGPDRFPYGAYRRGKKKEIKGTKQTALLDRLRQRGNYLTPGAGINLFSLISVVLRGTFLSMMVFFPLITFIVFILTLDANKFELVGMKNLTLALVASLVIFVIAIVSSLVYALHSYNGHKQSRKILTINNYLKKAKDKIAKRFKFINSHSLSIKNYNFRRLFEKYVGILLVAFLILLCFASLPPVYNFIKSTLQNDAILTSSVGIFMSIAGALGSFLGYAKTRTTTENEDPTKSVFSRILPWVTAGVLIFGILLMSYSFIDNVIYKDCDTQTPLTFTIAKLVSAIIIVAILAHYVNLNYITIHRFYRDRLMETFLPNVDDITSDPDTMQGATKANIFKLSDLANKDKNPISPLHLINTNLVLIDSKHRKSQSRGGDSFVFSPLFSGSESTGWCNTNMLSGGDITLATAMAISGAAANPNTGAAGEGPTRNPAFALLMSLLNIRLGFWIVNPWYTNTKSKLRLYKASPNFLDPLLSSLLSGVLRWKRHNKKTNKASYAQDEYNKYIELTDGGHFENLGLYELIRRNVKKILIIDAAADPNYQFSDLANAIEKIRVDFGVILDININQQTPSLQCVPHNILYSESSVAHGTLKYPNGEIGDVIYLKTCFTKGLPPDLISYKLKNPDFPDQSTGDQFFDEKQFEAYRELGYCLAKELDIAPSKKSPADDNISSTEENTPTAETPFAILFEK